MIDPICMYALSYTAYHALSVAGTFAAVEGGKAIFGKAVGDGAFAGVQKTIELIASKKEKQAENHDLQKALRKSMLNATSLVCEALKEQKEEAAFAERLQKWIAGQITDEALDAIEKWSNWNNAAEGNTEFFFATQEEYKEGKEALVRQMTTDWLNYLTFALGNGVAPTRIGYEEEKPLPEAFTNRLLNGFTLEGKELNWADAVMVAFSELLRDDQSALGQRANRAFNQNFLSEIKLKLDKVEGKVDAIHALILEKYPDYTRVLELNAQTMHSQQGTIEKQHKTIDELRAELKEVRAKLEAGQQLLFKAVTDGSMAKGRVSLLKEQLNKLERKQEELIRENETLKREAIAERKETIDQLKEEGKDDDLLAEAARLMEEGRFMEARELQIRSAEQLKVLSKESAKEAAKQYYELADLDEDELRYADALLHFREAAQLQPKEPRYLNALGYFLSKMALHTEAIEYLQTALELLTETKEHQRVKGTILNNLGMAWKAKGAYDKAIDYYERALELGRKVLGREHPKVATYLNNLGTAWDSKGAYYKAIGYYKQALEIDSKVLGEEHPDTATDLNNLGEAWRAKGEYDKAIDHYEQALAIVRNVFGETHPYVAATLNNLGLAWKAKGAYEKAIDYYERALEIDRKVFGQEHPNVAIRLNNLGGAWRSKGAYDKSIDYYEQALEIDSKVLGEEHPKVAVRLNNLGGAYFAKEHYSTAILYFEKAKKIFIQFLGEEHPNTENVRAWLQVVREALAEQQSKKD